MEGKRRNIRQGAGEQQCSLAQNVSVRWRCLLAGVTDVVTILRSERLMNTRASQTHCARDF